MPSVKDQKYLVVIAGPTASGKSETAVRLALLLHTEILSADARQFYKELNIGTAKPSKKLLKQVPHHFVNFLSVKEDYTAGNFAEDAAVCLKTIFEEKNICILCGGSGLYIDAVIRGFDKLPPSSPSLRATLQKEWLEKGLASLQEKLRVADPAYYAQVDLQNPHRVIRALEIITLSGKRYSELRAQQDNSKDFIPVLIALELPREELYARIDARVDKMFANGLEAEARALLPLRGRPALQTLGYAELFACFDGKYSMEEAKEKIKQHTRNYAKRQITWFTKDKRYTWFSPGNHEEMLRFIQSRCGIS